MSNNPRFRRGMVVKLLRSSVNGEISRGNRCRVLRKHQDAAAIRVTARMFSDDDWVYTEKGNYEIEEKIHKPTGIKVYPVLDAIEDNNLGIPSCIVRDSFNFPSSQMKSHFFDLERHTLPTDMRLIGNGSSNINLGRSFENGDLTGWVILEDGRNSVHIGGLVSEYDIREGGPSLDIKLIAALPGFEHYKLVRENLLKFAIVTAYLSEKPKVSTYMWEDHYFVDLIRKFGFKVQKKVPRYPNGSVDLLFSKELGGKSTQDEILGYISDLSKDPKSLTEIVKSTPKPTAANNSLESPFYEPESNVSDYFDRTYRLNNRRGGGGES